MRHLGFFWGIGGVLALLLFAVYRLAPLAGEMLARELEPLHWLALLLWVPYMAYAEGYKGFHRAFAPRVVVRADHLRQRPQPLRVLFAPLFCMGYFHATRRRILTSFILTSAIVLLVLGVRLLPQPWRGIVDAGVVTGLLLGCASIVWFTGKRLLSDWPDAPPADLPAGESVAAPPRDGGA